MFVLHVAVKVKDGEKEMLENAFLGSFKAAISAQEGFKAATLLRPDGAGDYSLSIAFENQALQQKWVATDLHQKVWPMMEKHIAQFAVQTFTAV